MFSVLINHGHAPADLMAYSERKLKLFFRYAKRAENNQRADELDNLNLVFAGKVHPSSDKLRQ